MKKKKEEREHVKRKEKSYFIGEKKTYQKETENKSKPVENREENTSKEDCRNMLGLSHSSNAS